MKKILALLLSLVMLATLLAGCGGEETTETKAPNSQETTPAGNENQPTEGNQTAEGPQYGGHLNVRMASRPTGIDPLTQTGAWRLLYTTAVYENALTRDADNNICPGVCDFELSEDQLDLKLWVREGYTFSRGYDDVDIYDVEASINRALRRYSLITKYVKPYVQSVTVEGDQLHIKFNEYNDKCMYYFAAYQPWMGIMPKEICEKYANSYIINELEDAVGTGPYIFTDFQDAVRVTISKRDDYTPVDNSQYTGLAGTKYGYMDSITFWYNSTDASSALALLAGDYDMSEVIPTAYAGMAAESGITLTTLPSDQRTWIIFNTLGSDNPCAKYPSLRKAVMAAIDYELFLDVVCDGSQIFEGDNSGIILGTKYNTDAFTSQDYYGPANQAAVDKYLEAAKAEGYKGEPVTVVYHSGRTDIPTLLCDAMEEAGIPHKLQTMESTTYSSFVNDPSNEWDFTFSWNTVAYRPSDLSDAIMVDDYKSDVKDQLLAELSKLDPESEEYMAKWQELAQHTADGCYIGFLAAIDWWWWHPETLHPNDNGMARYVYNTYWEDPANHPKKQ